MWINRILVFLAVGALSLAGCASTPTTPEAESSAAPAVVKTVAKEDDSAKRMEEGEQDDWMPADKPPTDGVVVDVLKGDELVLEDGWVVRLAAIDVPTADYGKRSGDFYGKAAIDFVKKKSLNGKVKLEYDREQLDSYDRAIAYVHLADGTFLNEALIAGGYALSACFPPNTKHCDDFAKAQHQAVQGRLGIWDFNPDDWPKAGPADNLMTGVRVRNVIDGDTIQLEDGTVVRYIGIDAPESEASWREGNFGNAAFKANQALVEGQTISLEYDVEFSDPRGRELAYVYVEKGGKRVMVNEELVRQGVAWVAVFPPNVRHVRRLFESQEQAYRDGVGIWTR